jgi:hypothetical protein
VIRTGLFGLRGNSVMPPPGRCSMCARLLQALRLVLLWICRDSNAASASSMSLQTGVKAIGKKNGDGPRKGI